MERVFGAKYDKRAVAFCPAASKVATTGFRVDYLQLIEPPLTKQRFNIIFLLAPRIRLRLAPAFCRARAVARDGTEKAFCQRSGALS